MNSVKTTVVPVEMEQARQELERWRSTRPRRSPIPAPLWDAAVKLARQHGIYLTAQTLRLGVGRMAGSLHSRGLSPSRGSCLASGNNSFETESPATTPCRPGPATAQAGTAPTRCIKLTSIL